MVPTQQHQQRARRRGHEKQPAVRKHILIQTPAAIFVPHAVDLFLGVTIQNAEVKVTARSVDSASGVRVAGVKHAVDHEVGKREEERAHASGVLHKLLAAHESIEYEAGIRKRRGRREVGSRNGAGIRGVCLAKAGKERDVVGAVGVAESILDGVIRRSGCVLGKDTEVGAGRVGEILVN